MNKKPRKTSFEKHVFFTQKGFKTWPFDGFAKKF